MRTIDLTPTWPEAARIIAAALENGTGEGRDAARSELFRMANLLDQLQRAEPVQHTPTVRTPDTEAVHDLGHFALVVEAEDGTALRMKGDEIYGDRETANAVADAWNDFAATTIKGTGQRFAIRRLSA